MNVNSLGEVPDSSWFTNRIGVRRLPPNRIARGPGDGLGPDRSEAWTVTRVKTSGVAPGLFIEDARGHEYLLKFDPKAEPEGETGAAVVVQRLLWAAGYNVPDEEVVRFERGRLRLGPDATKRLPTGERVAVTRSELDRLIDHVARAADGRRLRALASKLVEGEALGGYPMTGVRADDPNDRVPHEHRRDVRGQKAFFSWLKHTDVTVPNTLDVWVEQPPGSGLGHVEHYLLDFGKALGGKGHQGYNPPDGRAYLFDYEYATASLLSFGLWKRPWEGVPHSELRGVGRFTAAYYEPGRFRQTRPYAPFWFTDRFDAYWASKIIMRFSREHIIAAVRQARYSDPRTRRYLVDTIVARQRKTARHWFGKVNPVDSFRVDRSGGGWRICGRDLSLLYRLGAPARETRYELAAYGWNGRPTGWRRRKRGNRDGSVCAGGLRPAATHEGYTMIVYRTWRGERSLPAIVVHLARRAEGSGTFRVIGIERR